MPPAATTQSRSPSVPPTIAGRAEFERLLDEVETGFDAILEPGPPPDPSEDPLGLPTSENVFDHQQAHDLFNDLVVANARSLRDFMIEVRLGEPHTAWIDYCGPSVRALLGSAQGMGFGDLADKLRTYIGALDAAKRSEVPIVRGALRERVIDTYSELIVFFPEAFALEAESNARETAIVRALLSRVQGLHVVGLDRIRETGLLSLGLFFSSSPSDLALLSGIAPDVAERVSARFADYRKRVSEISPLRGRAEERSRLREAASALLAATGAYDRAQPTSVEKRAFRRARNEAMTEASLWLARLGEVERLRELETLPYAERARRMLAMVEDAERRATVEGRSE